MESTTKRPRGRPIASPDGAAATAQLQFRVSPGRKQRYVRAAEREKQPLAAWALGHLDRASEFEDAHGRLGK